MVFTCRWLLSVFIGYDRFWVLFHFHLAPRLITQTALVCIRNEFAVPQEEKGRRKKKHLNTFDLGCRVCFISSPPLHLLFPFSAPLAPYMHSNHHLGKPDKLGSRHQHLGAALKSFLETAGSFIWPSAAVWVQRLVSGACLALFQSTVSPFFTSQSRLQETRRSHPRQGEEIYFWCIYLKDLAACFLLQVSQIILPPRESGLHQA